MKGHQFKKKKRKKEKWKAITLVRFESGMQSHHECYGVCFRNKLSHSCGRNWRRVQKGELEDQRKSLRALQKFSAGGQLRPGSGKQDRASCRVEPQRRAGGDIYGKLLPLPLGGGLESLFVSRACSWEQELDAEQEHKDQMESAGSLMSVSSDCNCPPLTSDCNGCCLTSVFHISWIECWFHGSINCVRIQWVCTYLCVIL